MARNIYYFCPDVQLPLTGAKTIYEHVARLNEMGHSAYVVHFNYPFKYKLAPTKVPIAYPNIPPIDPMPTVSVTGEESFLPPFSREDILVFPAGGLHRLAPMALRYDLPFVVFNQNPFHTFSGLKLPKDPFSAVLPENQSLYPSQNILGTIVTSEQTAAYLRFIFPNLKDIYCIPFGIDTSIYSFKKTKRKQIVFMGSDAFTHASQIVFILRERNNLPNWDYVPLDFKKEKRIATLMRQSAIFLSFSHEETFTFLPAEAMACGCVVVGYDGTIGSEFLKPPYGYPIEYCNIVDFAQTVEKIALKYENDPQVYQKQCHKTAKFVCDFYPKEREIKAFQTTWDSIIQNHNAWKEN